MKFQNNSPENLFQKMFIFMSHWPNYNYKKIDDAKILEKDEKNQINDIINNIMTIYQLKTYRSIRYGFLI